VAKTLAQGLLPVLDTTRSIGGLLGLRPFTVTLRLRTTWANRPGPGMRQDGEPITLTNRGPDGKLYPVMVKQVSRQDVIQSGGLYAEGDYKVGPMTPPYPAGLSGAGGGFGDESLDPGPTADLSHSIEELWTMHGPGLPEGGLRMTRIGLDATALHYIVTLRRTGRPA
jgi:hypothetical protein